MTGENKHKQCGYFPQKRFVSAVFTYSDKIIFQRDYYALSDIYVEMLYQKTAREMI